jgi:hypothetical protein
LADSVEVVTNDGIPRHQRPARRAIEHVAALGVSVASRSGGKRNNVGNSLLGEAKPIRYPISPDTVDDLLNRRFGLQHSRLNGALGQRRAPPPFAPGNFLNYFEASEDEHREPVEAIQHGRVDPDPTEPTAKGGGRPKIHVGNNTLSRP